MKLAVASRRHPFQCRQAAMRELYSGPALLTISLPRSQAQIAGLEGSVYHVSHELLEQQIGWAVLWPGVTDAGVAPAVV